MKTKVIQQFTAIIVLEKKHDKGLFTSTEYILQTIEEKFGEVYNAKFVEDLKQAIETYTVKQEDFCAAYMERELVNVIEEADSFEDIQFDEFGLSIFSYYLNKKIKDGSYIYKREY